MIAVVRGWPGWSRVDRTAVGWASGSGRIIIHQGEPKQRTWPRRRGGVARGGGREPASSFEKEGVTNGVRD